MSEQDDEEERRRRDRERRRRRRRRREDDDGGGLDAVADACELADSARGCAGSCGRLGRCDGCDGPCNLLVFRVSTLLVVAAAVVPARGAGGLVRAALRGYQQWLSRFTPTCPSTPSCSAYALAAVERHGARRGLRSAAARVRDCGRTGQDR